MASPTRTLTLAALTALGSLALGPVAGAQAYGDGGVGQVCERVVGVSPGEKHYAACVQSLSDSMRNLRQGQGVAMARRDCLARGLTPQTPAFAECELAAAPARVSAAGDPGETPEPGGSRSYFMISRGTAFQRDQLACARLGFDPDQEGFSGCVADLRAALSRASEPAM